MLSFYSILHSVLVHIPGKSHPNIQDSDLIVSFLEHIHELCNYCSYSWPCAPIGPYSEHMMKFDSRRAVTTRTIAFEKVTAAHQRGNICLNDEGRVKGIADEAMKDCELPS